LHNLDDEGRRRSTLTKTHDVLLIEGSPYRILLEENGEPAPASDRQKHEADVERVCRLRRQETPAQREERISEFRKRLARYHKAVQEIPDAFNFRLLGEELIRGRPAYYIDVTPRPGYRPVDRYSRLFTQVTGKLWIDKQDLFWARVDSELRETVTFGWILVRIHAFSRVSMTQVRVDNGVWLPERLWYRVSLRVGLLRSYHLEEETLYGPYVEAGSDPRLARFR